MVNPIKILFLASSPNDQAQVRLDVEFREIQSRLEGNDKFDLRIRPAVRPRDVLKSIVDEKPFIVHFSGHGSETGELFLENDQGKAQSVTLDALAALFREASEYVKCVVINACYSRDQAKAIAQYIPFVIGMREAVSDKAATEFATGFYTALESDQIEKAFGRGCVAIQLGGFEKEHLTPQLIFGDPRSRFRAEAEQVLSKSQTASSTSGIIFRKGLLEKGRQMKLPPGVAEEVIDEIFNRNQEAQLKLKEYQTAFEEAVRDEYPLEKTTLDALKFHQRALELGDEDVEQIESKVKNNERWFSADAYIKRGFIQGAINEPEKALEYFNKAIEIKPQNSAAHMGRGSIFQKLGDYQSSIAEFTKAIEINDNWGTRNLFNAYFERGYAYFDLAKQSDKTENMNFAVDDFTEAIRLRSTSSTAYYNRALAYETLGRHQEAVKDNTKAIEYDSDWTTVTIAHAYYGRGVNYECLGKFADSKQDFKEAAIIVRNNPNPSHKSLIPFLTIIDPSLLDSVLDVFD